MFSLSFRRRLRCLIRKQYWRHWTTPMQIWEKYLLRPKKNIKVSYRYFNIPPSFLIVFPFSSNCLLIDIPCSRCLPGWQCGTRSDKICQYWYVYSLWHKEDRHGLCPLYGSPFTHHPWFGTGIFARERCPSYVEWCEYSPLATLILLIPCISLLSIN